MKGFFLIELSILVLGILVILLGVGSSSSHAGKAIQQLRLRQIEDPAPPDSCTTSIIHDEQLIRCEDTTSQSQTVHFLGS